VNAAVRVTIETGEDSMSVELGPDEVRVVEERRGGGRRPSFVARTGTGALHLGIPLLGDRNFKITVTLHAARETP
jgi:hypothetical protein